MRTTPWAYGRVSQRWLKSRRECHHAGLYAVEGDQNRSSILALLFRPCLKLLEETHIRRFTLLGTIYPDRVGELRCSIRRVADS